MRHLIPKALTAALLALTAAACSDSSLEPRLTEVVATLAYLVPDDPNLSTGPNIEVAVSGRNVHLRIRTYGYCLRIGRLVVEVEGMEAVVTPYNLQSRTCDSETVPGTVDHETTIEFPADGPAQVRVRGLRSDYSDEEPLEVELVVEVGGD